MKSITGVIGTAKTAIRNSSAISSFCTSNYSKSLKIFVGLDPVNPPTEDDAPFVVLCETQTPYDVGTSALQRRPSFEVYWGVVNKTQTTSDSGNTVTQTGLTNVDTLGMLIVTALESAFTGAGGDNFQIASYLIDGVAPLWQGAMMVTLVYEQGTGEA